MTFAAEATLVGLKPFQRDTVEYVFERFFGADPVDRFLVADEVGLGKTMIARGLIAKLIEHHLGEAGRRIDIVYICSNQAIAQQNFSKLAIVGRQRRAVTDRITTLPLHVGGLEGHAPGFDRGINIIPLTPTTSLDLRSSVGRVDERVLLWWLLTHQRLFGMKAMRRLGVRRLFMPPVRDTDSFEWWRKRLSPKDIDDSLWNRFVEHVTDEPLDRGDRGVPLELAGRSVLDEVADLGEAFRSERRVWAKPWSERRIAVVAQLRRILAGSCIDALEPDLVILDEFQRFPRLLDGSTPTGELARELFDYRGCKSLLLSATPYRMFSRAAELEESHYQDFLTTSSFLVDDEDRMRRLERSMGEYRTALRSVSNGGLESARAARDQVRDQLVRVMCRTERLGAAHDRNGMLDAKPAKELRARLATADLRSYGELEQIARSLGTRDVVEFWKSAPYALNLMDGYKLSEAFEKQARGRHAVPVAHRLDAADIRGYGKIDPGNARLRGLLEQLDEERAGRCLWLPPSMPYYASGRPFSDASAVTKRLVFSAWKVVPKAIASLVSYHVERGLVIHAASEAENSPAGRKAIGQPLQWRTEGNLTELLLVAPARELARLTDPLVLAQNETAEPSLVSRDRALRLAERAVASRLAGLELPPVGGRSDHSWYLVAALRLDEAVHPGSVEQWLRRDALGAQENHGVWASHVDRVRRALRSNDGLGPVPSDLPRILAYVGLAAPGPCALRALQRVAGDAPHELPTRALEVANALRLLLNLPEAVLAVRSWGSRRSRIQSARDVYWRSALDYCVAGNLQAVLDEYVHALRDWVGGSDSATKLEAIAATAVEAIGLNAATLPARSIGSDGRLDSQTLSFRSRFAVRLDRGQGEDEQSVQRLDTVRKAFNSPFWPFVLATTSVGQEGLDFHLYSHAVVHWNLPHNPVDLEQREGRVHRFKNHAVRRNLAVAHRTDGLAAAPDDPWRAMFDAAPLGKGGLEPYWVFTGEARIERHVPTEPLSIDRYRLDELVRLMGIYRLAFGQPRQDELLAALGDVEEDLKDLVIELAPPPAPTGTARLTT